MIQDGETVEETATLVSGPAETAQTQLRIEASGFAPLVSWSGNPVFAISAPPSTPATVQQALTLTNTGTAPAEDVAPSVSGDTAFALVSTTCGATLEPGASCIATVSFTANSDVASVAGLLSGGPGLPSLQLSGTASGIAPALAWSGAPVSLDGTPPQALPVTGQATYTLLNTGNQDATGLGTVSIVGAGWSLVSTTCGATLAQGASCDATLRLEAWTNGAFPGTLSIDGGPSIGVSGSASGFAPVFVWSGASTFTVSSPTQTPALVERTFTLTNTGTLAGTPAVPTVSGSGAGFAYSLVSHTCSTSLAVGDTCQAIVRATFTNNVASASGTLGGPSTQALTGSASGFAPAWAFDGEPSGTFTIAAPATTATKTFTLRNTGTLGAAPPARSLSGTAAARYSITGGTCGAASVAPGGTCTVSVTFTANDNLSNQTATLTAGSASRALTGSASGFALTWRFVGRFILHYTCMGGVIEGEFHLIGRTGVCPMNAVQFPPGGTGFQIGANTGISCPSVGATCYRTIGSCMSWSQYSDAFRCQ